MDEARYESGARQGMRTFLEDKYGIEFDVERFKAASNPFTGAVYDTGYAQPRSKADDEFIVKRYEDDGGNSYEDGYSYRLAEDYLAGRVGLVLKDEFDDVLVSDVFLNSPADTTEYVYRGSFDWSDFRTAEEGRSSLVLSVMVGARQVEREAESLRLQRVIARLEEEGLLIYRWTFRVLYAAPDVVPNVAREELRELDPEDAAVPIDSVVILWGHSSSDPPWDEARIAEQFR